VLLLVTYREEALVANDPLRLTLGGLASQRATRRLSVPTLSTPGVATLARGTGIDATELHRLTAGNPFFVTEVLQTGSDALPVSVHTTLWRLGGRAAVATRKAWYSSARFAKCQNSSLWVAM
jgi:hypothetical protein